MELHHISLVQSCSGKEQDADEHRHWITSIKIESSVWCQHQNLLTTSNDTAVNEKDRSNTIWFSLAPVKNKTQMSIAIG